MKKKFKYDGKSRPTTELYKKNFNRIFGKKETEDPFKKEQEELKESYEQSKKSKKERQTLLKYKHLWEDKS